MNVFSVLVSVYHREKPEFLDEALCSIEDQTLPPSEIILVKDGPLTQELEEIILSHSQNSEIDYKIVVLEKNRGLGEALNEGLKYCSHDWVARMDTDDIAMRNRFEAQFLFLAKNPKVDIVGGWICEFYTDSEICDKERKVPAQHEEIIQFSKFRNPLNHMTVVFRKKAVLDVEGYQSMNGFEDYYLWMRMIVKGKRFANLSEILVKARTGKDMIVRRQGWRYGKDELFFEKAAYNIGFWTGPELCRNFFIRFLPRLLPVFIVEKLYNVLRKF